MSAKIDFFADLSESLIYWAKVARSSITEQSADLIWVKNEAAFNSVQNALADRGLSDEVEIVFKECMEGLAHSFLCILDGATKMSKNGRAYLVDSHERKLGEGLHEEFAEFLCDQDRSASRI